MSPIPTENDAPSFSLLTNHGAVVLLIAASPDIRLHEIAYRAGIARRTAQFIVSDLAEAGYISRRRVGRKTVYDVHPEQPLRRRLLIDSPTLAMFLGILDHIPPGPPSAKPRHGAA